MSHNLMKKHFHKLVVAINWSNANVFWSFFVCFFCRVALAYISLISHSLSKVPFSLVLHCPSESLAHLSQLQISLRNSNSSLEHICGLTVRSHMPLWLIVSLKTQNDMTCRFCIKAFLYNSSWTWTCQPEIKHVLPPVKVGSNVLK